MLKELLEKFEDIFQPASKEEVDRRRVEVMKPIQKYIKPFHQEMEKEAWDDVTYMLDGWFVEESYSALIVKTADSIINKLDIDLGSENIGESDDLTLHQHFWDITETYILKHMIKELQKRLEGAEG